MFPTLFRVGPLYIRAYGFFLAIAFICGLLFLKKKTRKLDISDDTVDKLFLWILLSAVVGSRLLYVMSNWKSYSGHIVDVFRVWEGGFHFYGGFIGAIVAVVFFTLTHRDFPLLKFADASAPSIALGFSIGKIGCFFAGCCYGKACTLPWAVYFTNPDSLAIRGIGLHPSQIYEFAAYFLIFLIMQSLYDIKNYDGELFSFFIFIFSFVRFHLEFFRWDEKFIFGITLAGFISAIFMVVSIILLVGLSKKWKKKNI